MTTVEAAASLFGSEDESSDPFAILGDDTVTFPLQSAECNTVYNPENITGNGGADYRDQPEGQGGFTTSAAHWSGQQVMNQPVYDTSSFSQASSGVSSRYEEPRSWNDGQQQVYDQIPSQTNASGHAVVQNYATASNSYDPYAFQANHASPPSDEPRSSVQMPAYDTNNHAARNFPKTYDPPQIPTLPSQPKYDSYKPAKSPYQTPLLSQTTTSQSYPVPYTSKATVTSTTSPPAAVLNRPKNFNAYDPPFPPSKPAKRNIGRSALKPPTSFTPQSIYGSYSTMPTHPDPPGAPPVMSSSRGADYFDTTRGLGVRVPSSLPDVRSLPRNDRPYSDIQPTIADSHTRTEQPYTGPGYITGDTVTHQPQRAWHPPQGSYDSRITNQVSLSYPMTHGTTSPTQSNFSHYQEGSRLAVGDEADRTIGSSGFASTSPPSTAYLGNGPYDPHASQYYVPSNAASQRAISPDGQFQAQQRPQHANFESSAIHKTDVRDAGISGFEQDKGRGVSQDYLPMRESGDSDHRPSFQDSSPDDKEAFVGRMEVQLPDVDTSMSFDETNVVQNSYAPGLDLGGVGITSMASANPMGGGPILHDPYSPRNPNANTFERISSSSIEKQLSPKAQPGPFPNGSQNMRPHSPATVDSVTSGNARLRSNSSAYSLMSNNTEDPYAPSHHRLHGASESDTRTNSIRYGYPVGPTKPLPADHLMGQELLVGSLNQTPYAPSPSLLGLNDPLGRTTARVPVFSFGFGGKLVTCFHGSSVLNTGFDVALASRRSMDVNIRVLTKIIPASALDISTVTFPGPLFADPGTPTTSLVRSGAAAQMKTKKARASKYLLERTEELARGIGYLQPGTEDRRKLEGKLVLVKLLKVMVENEGRLSGSPQIDTAVRAALVPRLALSATAAAQDSNTTSGPSPADMHTSISDLGSFSYSSLNLSQSTSHETPISVSALHPSALDKIQEFLLRGERQKACYFAMDEKLWAHAMLIASSIDKDMWKAVVSEFLRAELGNKDGANHGGQLVGGEPSSICINGRESLRVAYSMFSGQGAASVQELSPQVSHPKGTIQIAGPSHATPVTANFLASIPQPFNVPLESLSKWAETIAMMLNSNMTIESSSALTALGDCLAHHRWIEAAHVCYLLAAQTSPIGGLGQPSTRIVLLGSSSPLSCPNFHKDPDPIIFSEVLEFALSIAAPSKGQEAFGGLPHLQAYRLIRAMSLAEIGQMQLASRYCEAITASLNRSSPYFTPTFMEQLRLLSDRIIAAPHIDKSMSWIGGKMSKPSLDSIGTWLEGRFTKLITGDGDGSPGVMEQNMAGHERSFSGPFSHYSTISSATTSTSPSPQPSGIDLPQRSGSAMAYPLVTNSHVQIDRASSAIDYSRRKHSPAPRIAPASARTTSFSQAPTYFNGLSNNYSLNDPVPALDSLTPKQFVDGQASATNEDVSWWGSSYVSESSARTPTATSYLRVDESRASSSSSGFISLMDDASVSVTPTVRHTQESHEEEEDLGFGNPTKREKASQDGDRNEIKASTTDKTEPVKETVPEQSKTSAVSSSSWFGRFGLWGKREQTPGPVKANLGEEKTFYYDKELKRWVNKQADAEASSKAAAPPPPPSRSQTTSPGRSGTTLSPSNTGPLIRPASAIDLTTQPPKSAMRVRSNLIPKESDSTLPTTPMSASSSGPPPPPTRPRSQAAKRNIRSRYVDVLQ